MKIVPDTVKKSAFRNGFTEIKITTNSKKPFKVIAETAKIGNNVNIGPCVVIEDNVCIENGSREF